MKKKKKKGMIQSSWFSSMSHRDRRYLTHTPHFAIRGLVSLVSEDQESDKWEEESNIPIVNSIEGKCYYFPCFLLVRVVDPSEGNEPQNMFRVPPLYCPLWAQTKMDEWIPMRCKVIYQQIDPLRTKIQCVTKYTLHHSNLHTVDFNHFSN